MKYMSLWWLWLWLPCLAAAQSGSFRLGAGIALVSAAPGNASVELLAPSPTATWTVTSNAPWLHVGANSKNGSGSALIQFSYDANAGTATQIGTLTIAGQNFTVTQAGSGFSPFGGLGIAVQQSLYKPYAVALDTLGNVYIADSWNNTIQEWSPVTQQMTVLVSSGLNHPHGLAVDGQGNIYVADTYNNAIDRWNPSTQLLTTVVSSGLSAPMGVAVDVQANLYIADYGNNAIEQWNATSQQLTPLVSAGLKNPTGVAVDLVGNVYFADFGNNAVKQWSPTNAQVTTLPFPGLSLPNSVAVDGQGNVFVVDGNHNALLEWNAANQAATTLVSSGINGSFGVSADGQGSWYIANTSTSSILKFSSGYFGLGVTSLTEGAQAGTDSISIQILGASLPLAAASDQPWLIITGSSASSITFSFQANPSAVSRTGHITVQGQQVTITQIGDVAATVTKSAGDGQSIPINQPFPGSLQVLVTDAGGVPVRDAPVNFQVTPGAGGASAVFSSNPPMPITTDQNGSATAPGLTANGIAGPFTVSASAGSATATFTLSNSSSSFALGTSSVIVGSGAGSGTVLLLATGAWTAASNTSWLQISMGSTSGAGNSIIQFTYAANSNTAPQTGTLTIAGLTFTVIQASTNYVPTSLVTTLASGLNHPQGVALDTQNNVYIADTGNNAIKKCDAVTQQLTPLISAGLNNPAGIAVDTLGNLFIADSGNGAIEEWSVSGQNLTPIVPGLSSPLGVATDTQNNVYYSDTGNSGIGEWNAVSQQVNTLPNSGVSNPSGIATDALGNIYFSDTGHNLIGEWNAVSQQVATLLSSGLSGPSGVATDGQGNAYFADTGNSVIKQWNSASLQVVTLPTPGLSNPTGVAVDRQGNLYVADTNNGAIKTFVFGFVSLSATVRNESAQAGSDSVTAQVLPTTMPLSPISDQPWLVITSATGGVISFSFQANTLLTTRAAHITVLGQQVTVTQSGDLPASITKSQGDGQTAAVGQAFGVALQVTVTDAGGVPMSGVGVTFSVVPGASGAGGTFAGTPGMPILTDQNGHATAPVLTANTTGGTFTVAASVNQLTANFNLTNLAYALAAPSVIVGTAAGNGEVWLVGAGPWSAASNASWLQLVASSGSGNTLIQFSYSANSSTASRTGTLTIAGLTFTVTQTGTSYTTVNFLQTLVSSGLKNPQGIALDSVGNVYIADTSSNTVKKWTAATKALSTPVPSGLNTPAGVSVDAKGNIYIADSKNNAIKVWNVTNQQVTSLGIGTLNLPIGIAVDSQGNVYLSDSGHNAIKEWVAATKVVTTLVSGLNGPRGVAVDPQGNVYFADTNNNQVKEWIAATKAVVTLVSGLNSPRGVALDSQNNLYIADANNNAIKQWNPTSLQVVTLPVTGLKGPGGVAVDSAANVYIGDTNDSIIREFTAGYLAFSASSRNEGPQAGTDSVTAFALPASLPLAATSNQSWLKITGSSGGVISFSFTANTSVNSRTAQITVLGQSVTVTQGGDVPTTMTIAAGNGQSTPVSHAFATALEVRVKDAAGNGVGGVAVTFTVTPGTNGASGTFASSAPVITTAGGYATASTLTANSVAGSFTVSATSSGLGATFHLTITSH
jgi:streptogramin lyase